MEIFTKLNEWIEVVIGALGIYGPILGCFLIVIESIIPVLPLFVFITLNFLTFGKFLGFIISWIFTVIGCLISFGIFRKGLRNWFTLRVRSNEKVDKLMKNIDKFKFHHLVTLIAVPFTPAFAINIAAGISEMKFKKFFIAILIGKVFMVYFWGFVGTSLIQSLTNPIALIKVVIACILAYLASVVIGKIVNLDEEEEEIV